MSWSALLWHFATPNNWGYSCSWSFHQLRGFSGNGKGEGSSLKLLTHTVATSCTDFFIYLFLVEHFLSRGKIWLQASRPVHRSYLVSSWVAEGSGQGWSLCCCKTSNQLVHIYELVYILDKIFILPQHITWVKIHLITYFYFVHGSSSFIY